MSSFRHRVVEGSRVGLIFLLTLLISGLLPMLIQAYGYYDMAQKSGGIENIVEVVTEAPACEFCIAAQELQNKSEPDKQAPVNEDRVEIVKSHAIFHDQDFFRAPPVGPFEAGRKSRSGDELAPDSWVLAPVTPPPEVFG